MNTDLNLIEISNKTKSALISVGFSEQEADSQLHDLSDIIMSAFSQKVSGEIQVENPDQTRKIFFEVATPIVAEYIQEISKGLDDADKKKLFDQINALSEK